ncbi:hypothetical protein RHECIAT_PA0000145 (plasmid) [Rhizobium etli CIAT 652]|uniref:Uncharacterized protein n=1 Tax=Rhizobium etli (strain CIAT 652) TaxID=491916 RepID=B3Q1D4_RHIE6|nr:hypothetical protein RHECIAT_PA0000145 [Rhizobium etli CIAT 652]
MLRENIVTAGDLGDARAAPLDLLQNPKLVSVVRVFSLVSRSCHWPRGNKRRRSWKNAVASGQSLYPDLLEPALD